MIKKNYDVVFINYNLIVINSFLLHWIKLTFISHLYQSLARQGI